MCPQPAQDSGFLTVTALFAGSMGPHCRALPSVDPAVPRLQWQGHRAGVGIWEKTSGLGGKSMSSVLVCEGCLNNVLQTG